MPGGSAGVWLPRCPLGLGLGTEMKTWPKEVEAGAWEVLPLVPTGS